MNGIRYVVMKKRTDGINCYEFEKVFKDFIEANDYALEIGGTTLIIEMVDGFPVNAY